MVLESLTPLNRTPKSSSLNTAFVNELQSFPFHEFCFSRQGKIAKSHVEEMSQFPTCFSFLEVFCLFYSRLSLPCCSVPRFLFVLSSVSISVFYLGDVHHLRCENVERHSGCPRTVEWYPHLGPNSSLNATLHRALYPPLLSCGEVRNNMHVHFRGEE